MDIPDIFLIYVSIRGKNWGEDGFIRIKKGVKMCGIGGSLAVVTCARDDATPSELLEAKE